MTQPRSSIISLEDTPYYHCICRCVRRAFLCGNDHYTGRNFDHRKPWFTQRLDLLCKAFSIDIAAYAIMSNHYHLVLHVDKVRSVKWSQDQVIRRWLMLYKGSDLIQRYLRGELHSEAEHQSIEKLVGIWRERLSSISWFMRCINEYVARKANCEDRCTGRFWESRFKSQALLDKSALISCMTYVDLNPIRAGISNNVERSHFTSVQARLKQIIHKDKPKPTPRLMPFGETIRRSPSSAVIPFNLQSYLELVDWTGRSVRNDKRGYIPQDQPSQLSTLGLSQEQWHYLALDVQKDAISMLHGLKKLVSKDRHKEKLQPP